MEHCKKKGEKMKITTYLEKKEDLDFFQNVSEVILQIKELSRFGKLSLDEAHELATLAKAKGLKPVIEWDILMTENVFQETLKTVKQIDFSIFNEVRAQDPGALGWLQENCKEISIALILETGNHNFLGIESWCKHLGNQLSKVVLSIELPHERLKSYIEQLHQLDIKVELLGLGRILLFYTPRSLLMPVVFDHEDNKEKIIHQDIVERLASSEESPHKGFPVVETKHGTFMFHIKDHWLMENILDLKAMKLDWIRIDLRFGKNKQMMTKISSLIKNYQQDQALQLKDEYPTDVIKGFFNVNKTDTLFGKLKNMKLQRKDKNYLGDVYEVIKEDSIIFMNRSREIKIKKGMEIIIVNPDGKEIPVTIKKLKNTEGFDVDSIEFEQLAVINPISAVVARSQVYLKEMSL
jgi:putative protease